jgi:AAA+ ATPase superfamily predicted ATPase
VKWRERSGDTLLKLHLFQFVAVYGRRRVGKTFLIKQALKGRITFQHTGVSPVDQDGESNKKDT